MFSFESNVYHYTDSSLVQIEFPKTGYNKKNLHLRRKMGYYKMTPVNNSLLENIDMYV